MVKDFIRKIAQQVFGLPNYLFLFSIGNIIRMRWGMHEKAFLHFTSLIKKEGAIIDIGANVGMMSAYLSKKNPKAVIYAFEPIDINYQTLKRVIRFFRLQNIKAFPLALGNQQTTVKMVLPIVANAYRQGFSHVITDMELVNGIISEVPMEKLDEIVEINALPSIAAIKIDVENFEFEVLQGAKQLLLKHKPLIFCELWNDHHRSDCFLFMENLGYEIHIWEKGQLIHYDGREALDFFFIPNG